MKQPDFSKTIDAISFYVQPGDVLTTRSSAHGFFTWILYKAIIFSQWLKWRKSTHRPVQYRDIHAQLVLGDMRVLSVEWPIAVIRDLRISKRTKSISVCRFNSADFKWSDKQLETIHEVASSIEGTRYDPGDIIDMGLRQLGYIPKRGRLFNFGAKRTVCSVGALLPLLAAWKKSNNRNIVARPLGWQFAEDAKPADFRMHPTFVEIATFTRPKKGWA